MSAANGPSGRERGTPCTVLVTDAWRGAAVASIRSLARAGHRVVAADSAALSAGRWSRHAARSVRYPDPSLDPGAAGRALAHLAHAESVDVILPVTDAVISAIERERAHLPAGCVVAVADRSQLNLVQHKASTLALAEQLGVPVPRSVLVATVAEARRAAPQLGWPVVVKPESSTVETESGELVKLVVSYARDEAELESRVRPLAGRSTALLQEYCGGEGHGVEVLAHQGTVLAAFQHRRMREVPFSGGASSLREAVALDPDLFEHAKQLVKALGWTGVAMVEFKCGDRGPRLMEINGRLWGSLPLAVKAGVDFPADLVELLTTGPPPPGRTRTDYKVGVRSRNVRLETLWIAAALRGAGRHPVVPSPTRLEGLRALGRLLLPGDGYDILSWRDPMAGLAELLQIAAKPFARTSRA